MLYRVLKSIIHNTCSLRLVIVALRESEPKTAPVIRDTFHFLHEHFSLINVFSFSLFPYYIFSYFSLTSSLSLASNVR